MARCSSVCRGYVQRLHWGFLWDWHVFVSPWYDILFCEVVYGIWVVCKLVFMNMNVLCTALAIKRICRRSAVVMGCWNQLQTWICWIILWGKLSLKYLCSLTLWLCLLSWNVMWSHFVIERHVNGNVEFHTGQGNISCILQLCTVHL